MIKFNFKLYYWINISILLTIWKYVYADNIDQCFDLNSNCHDWIKSDSSLCVKQDYISKSCRRSCHICTYIPEKFDVNKVPENLRPLSFLIGVWRSEFGGKAIFPTIPNFTFGEEIQISIADSSINSAKALNYTAFAWGINEQNELHSENGFITMGNDPTFVSLTTVMNNGFITVEEGHVSGNSVRFHLIDIGRISFSRDLPVHNLIREWTLLNRDTLEARLEMETLTHRLQEHTRIRYDKIFP